MLAKYFSFHTTNIQKYIDFYRQYAVALDAFLTALDTLAEGVLSTPIIDPVTLQTYIATIFLEVTNTTTCQTIWEHLTKVAVYPSQLFISHKLNSNQINMSKFCCV